MLTSPIDECSRPSKGLVAGLITLALSACQGLDDKLGTQVTAEGDRVRLTWTESHPWSQQISQSEVRLLAEYQQDDKDWTVHELDRARSDDGSTMRFDLPKMLPSKPTGRMCMLLRLPDGTPIPMRKPQGAGDDATRFRYPGWNAHVRARTAQQVDMESLKAQREKWREARRKAQKAIEAGQANLRSFERRQKAQGRLPGDTTLERPDDCEKIQVAADTKVGPPPVDPDAIDQAATRVCVRRALVGRSNVDKAQAADQAKRYVAVLPDLAHERDAEELGGLQDRFLNDWKEHLAVVRTEDYQPKLPRPAVIRMTPEGARAQHAFLNGDTSRAQAALAAALTSYETCVDDARTQLKTKLAAWRKRKAQAPQRQEALSDYLTKECRRYADVVTSARDTLGKARQRLDQLKARKTDGTEVPPLPSAEVRLDFKSCRR